MPAEVCAEHSGIEQKFETLLTRIDALSDAIDGYHRSAVEEMKSIRQKHNEDMAAINRRIDSEQEDREETEQKILSQSEENGKAMIALKEEVSKIQIRVLSWLIGVFGVPVVGWLVYQLVNLILRGGGE